MAFRYGYDRYTGEKITLDDTPARIAGIDFLYQVYGIEAYSNPQTGKIDLLYKNGKGGADVEGGKWLELYWNQQSQTFNQFTFDYPTGNFNIRKEKYLHEYFEYLTDSGNLKETYEPYYMNNKLIRFNKTFDQCFVVDHTHLKTMKKGRWKTNTYGTGDIEDWMTWELDKLDWFKKNPKGIWICDETFKDSEVYQMLVNEYKVEQKKFLLKINK